MWNVEKFAETIFSEYFFENYTKFLRKFGIGIFGKLVSHFHFLWTFIKSFCGSSRFEYGTELDSL